jgi:hypothetical protein
LNRQTPAQLYCTLAGAILVIAGIVGFFYSSGFETGASGVAGDTDEILGIFAVNGWGNVICIAWGLLALACANSAARSFALGFGLYAVVIAIWGFVDGDDVTFGLFAANGADNFLDLALGLTGLAAGAASPGPARKSRRERPRRAKRAERPSRTERSERKPAKSEPAKSADEKPATT